ncbi:UDP-N-acetylmuramate--L-alanine ligase, partial [bacterium LRH843]|nr:UDP-N-acetylmuramate--L-alanine ligase [bacterium LRH843]
LIAFQKEFEKAFSEADEVWLCDVYGAGENTPEGFDILKMAQGIQEHSQTVTRYVPQDQKIDLFKERVKPFDVFITLGAGDITAFAHEMT